MSQFKTAFKIAFKQIFGERSFGKISPIWHGFRGILANIWFGNPSKNMTLIGITGTKGKTSTTILTSRLLNYFGSQTGFFSTALMFDGKVETQNPTHMSTIDPWQMQKFLQKCAKNGCQNIVLELSSQGLQQNRHWGIKPLQIAVFLNIYPEHIQAHGSWENYRNCKAKLFGMLKNGGIAIANGEPKMLKNSDFMLKNLPSKCAKIFVQKLPETEILKSQNHDIQNPKRSKTQFYDIGNAQEFYKSLIWFDDQKSLKIETGNPKNPTKAEINQELEILDASNLVSNNLTQNLTENLAKSQNNLETKSLENPKNTEKLFESSENSPKKENSFENVEKLKTKSAKHNDLVNEEKSNSETKNSQIILKTQMVADYELTNLAFALTIAKNLSQEMSQKIQEEMSDPKFILQISPKIPGRMEWIVIDNEIVI